MRYTHIMRALISVIAFLLVSIGSSNPTHAQHIYSEIPLQHDAFGPLRIALYENETFFGPMQMRAIVIDQRDIVIAESPFGYNIRLHCGSDALISCTVYDPYEGVLFHPTLEPPLLEKPLEQYWARFNDSQSNTGFQVEKLGPFQQVKQASIDAWRAPQTSISVLLWWSALWWVLWRLFVMPLYRIITTRGREELFKEIMLSVIGLILGAAMGVATLFAIGLSTPSLFGLAAFAGFGLLVCVTAGKLTRQIFPTSPTL